MNIKLNGLDNLSCFTFDIIKIKKGRGQNSIGWIFLQCHFLTLFSPAYLSISRNRGLVGLGFQFFLEMTCCRLWNNSPYSKGFMRFGCLKTVQNIVWLLKFFVGREVFYPVCKGPSLWFFGICIKGTPILLHRSWVALFLNACEWVRL